MGSERRAWIAASAARDLFETLKTIALILALPLLIVLVAQGVFAAGVWWVERKAEREKHRS